MTLAHGGSEAEQRYSTVAVALHWIIALVLVTQLFVGWRMSNLIGPDRSTVLQLHKSLGITILILTLARLAWRLRHRPPPQFGLAPLERALSSWTHRAFYLVMLGLPLTGWAMISNTRGGAMTRLFGVIRWPPMPFLGRLPADIQDRLVDFLDDTHQVLAWMTVAMLALHVAGALKHQFISRDRVVARMVTWARPSLVWDPRLLAIPAMGILAAALAFAPKPSPPALLRAKPTELAQADIFLDVVQPILQHRCETCHSDDVTRGAFSVEGYAALMDGGQHGHTIVPGEPAESELFRRVSSPLSDDHHMPKGGHRPLTPQQVDVIGWWIAQGAPPAARVGNLAASPEMRPALASLLHLGGGTAVQRVSGEVDEYSGLPNVAPADPAVLAALEANHFAIRPVAKGAYLLEINYSGLQALTPAQRQMLDSVAQQVLSLSLPRSQVSDADLKSLARMTNLRRLRLEWNPIDDAGLAQLQGLKALRYLNLTGVRITDRGLTSLVSSLPRLHSIYVWHSGVSTQVLEALHQTRADIVIDGGASFAAPPLADTGSP